MDIDKNGEFRRRSEMARLYITGGQDEAFFRLDSRSFWLEDDSKDKTRNWVSATMGVRTLILSDKIDGSVAKGFEFHSPGLLRVYPRPRNAPAEGPSRTLSLLTPDGDVVTGKLQEKEAAAELIVRPATAWPAYTTDQIDVAPLRIISGKIDVRLSVFRKSASLAKFLTAKKTSDTSATLFGGGIEVELDDGH